ncbi:MAG TPA: YfiR family protein [Candidatus Marinimicrobia bacterium]|nr:YfiR family protein [Candidatus Neomarinimicrobiota bacterium]HNZ36418.1 YfiR family protein [Candidatus Neomarinimicrobiota bacterium]HOV23915.1 YfiR family protein [Candidatus Neomarinimicrobiota bacterium]HRD18318.1 YfiR family protein [Candidatus Neomarinimicrobiota bacterium]
MPHKNKIIVCIVCFLILSFSFIYANLPFNSESEINDLKAAFIYNFTKYITWPDLERNKVFFIGVIGNSDIVNSLRRVAEKKFVKNIPIRVAHYQSVDDLRYCHILFISASEKNQLDPILAKLKKRKTLTIGDTPGFCESGVMINFFMQEDRLKFEMNLAKLESAGLKASSQIKKLARIVE